MLLICSCCTVVLIHVISSGVVLMDWIYVTGVQVELVNLLDLQLLSDGDSPEKSDEDNGNEWRMNNTEKSMEEHPLISQLQICTLM